MPQVISKALQVVYVPVGFKKSPRLEGAGWRQWLASSIELSIRASIRVQAVHQHTRISVWCVAVMCKSGWSSPHQCSCGLRQLAEAGPGMAVTLIFEEKAWDLPGRDSPNLTCCPVCGLRVDGGDCSQRVRNTAAFSLAPG